MILHHIQLTLCIWFFIGNGDLFQQSLVKLNSLSLKIISKVVIGFPTHLEFIGDRVDFVIKDALILCDEGEGLHDFEVVLVDILDLEVDGIHLIDPLYNLVLLGHWLLL
jgi:hypothetical protein